MRTNIRRHTPGHRALRLLGSHYSIMAERYGVFSGGRVTRIMDDGTEREIRIGFDGKVAEKAGEIGVSRAEALAKVDWSVWERTLDAAYATDNLASFQVSGGWRQKGALGEKDTVHYKGRSLDINMINGEPVNYEYQTWEKKTGTRTQSDVVRDFSYNLKNGGASEVIQPWMTYNTGLPETAERRLMNGGFLRNTLEADLEWQHRNHLHVSFRR